MADTDDQDLSSEAENDVYDHYFYNNIYNVTRGEVVKAGTRGKFINIFDATGWDGREQIYAIREHEDGTKDCVPITHISPKLSFDTRDGKGFKIKDGETFKARAHFHLPPPNGKAYLNIGSLYELREHAIKKDAFWYVHNLTKSKFVFVGEKENIEKIMIKLDWNREKEEIVISDGKNIYAFWRPLPSDSLIRQYTRRDLEACDKIYVK